MLCRSSPPGNATCFRFGFESFFFRSEKKKNTSRMSWCVYAVRCRWRRLDFLHSPGVHSSVKMLSIKSSTSSESKMWRKGAGLVGFEMGKGQQIDTVRIQVRDPYNERSHLFLSVLASILWICIYQFYVCINMSLYSNQKTPCLVIIFSCKWW